MRARLLGIVLAAAVLPASALADPEPGTLDSSFGGDGEVTTDVSPRHDFLEALELDPSGRIVAAGGALGDAGGGTIEYGQMAVVRYLPSGAPDTGFSGDGKALVDVSERGDYAYDTAVQGDGRVVVAGAGATAGGDSVFAIARLTPDGSLDPTFAGDGTQVVDVAQNPDASSIDDVARGVAIAPDGGTILAGGAVSAGGALALVRYEPDGDLDPNFSGDGVHTESIPGGSALPRDVAIQPDGKIVVVGALDEAADQDGLVARFEPDGDLDPTFSGDGWHAVDLGSYDSLGEVALQSDGKIVGTGTSEGFTAVRFTDVGELDGSFGSGGVAKSSMGAYEGRAHAIDIAPDGSIVVGGRLALGGGGEFAAVRYGPGGAQLSEVSFARQPSSESSMSCCGGVAVQADGRVVLGGGSGDPYSGNTQFALTRFASLHSGLDALGKPVTGQTFIARPKSGRVMVRCRDDRAWSRLRDTRLLAFGCRLDTRRRARVEIRSTGTRDGSQMQTAEFDSGIFRVKQKPAARPVTDLVLAGRMERCNLESGVTSRGRRVRGRGKGRFRIVGRHASAGLGRSTWLVHDRCDRSTLVRVSSGRVVVRDVVKRRNRILRAGGTYVARPR